MRFETTEGFEGTQELVLSVLSIVKTLKGLLGSSVGSSFFVRSSVSVSINILKRFSVGGMSCEGSMEGLGAKLVDSFSGTKISLDLTSQELGLTVGVRSVVC